MIAGGRYSTRSPRNFGTDLRMCGIAGLYAPCNEVDIPTLGRMAAAMSCRGPDDQGTEIRQSIGLVHRRLAVIDLDGGHQPIFNEDQTLAIVCNGEIYDYRRTRADLERRGHSFRTRSDSEVILHLYEESGELCLDQLHGMFAFAIADFRRGELFLARDRFGKKPLFYAEGDGRFAFASGPAALSCIPWVDTGIDRIAIHDFLEYQYIPRPRSIYCGVRKIPPGHWLRWTGKPSSAPRPMTFWQPDLLPGFSGTFDDAAAHTRSLLAAAVSRRLVAEVPLGAFLSGGMDSSIVCALAQNALQEAGEACLNTYSIGFPNPKYDERIHAEAVARHLGTKHHFLEVNPAEFANLPAIVASFEEPFADASMVPTWLLSRFTRREVTVALSGDGADELFGGYYRYRIMHLCQALAGTPRRLRRLVQRPLLALLPPKTEERTVLGRIRRLVELLDVDGLERYLRLISRFPEPLRHRLYADDMRDAVRGHDGSAFLADHMPEDGRLADRIMELDCRTYLPEDILVKVDRAAMAHALEVRSPFLDTAVAEFALSLPYDFKQRGTERKRVLKHACADLLPGSILARRKMGFGMPIAQWFRNEWHGPAGHILLSGVLDPYFRRDRLEWFLRQHRENRADHSYGLFALAVLALWLDRGQPDKGGRR